MQYQNYENEVMISNEALHELDHSDYNKKPYCSLVSITSVPFNKPKGFYCYGTGTIISPNLILTSAHNLYDHYHHDQLHQQYHNVRYMRSPHGQVLKSDFKQIKRSKYDKVSRKQDQSEWIKRDFALLRLEEQHSHDVCMKLTICCPNKCIFTKKSQYLQIYGYPTSQLFSNYKPKDKEGNRFLLNQFGSRRQQRIKQVSYQSATLYYQLSTIPGQSGTAVMFGDKFVAIHKAGSQQKNHNFGRLITVEMVEKLIEWTIQLGGKPFKIDTENVCGCISGKIKELTEKIRAIDAKKDTLLNKSNIDIQYVQLSEYYFLKCLNLKMNKLKTIDLSQNPYLEELCLSSNELTAIDLSKNSELTQVYLSQNKIQKLDVSKNPKLTKLYLDDNKLADLDLSKNQHLNQLSFSFNKLKTIDLSNNPQLLRLSLSSNQLNTIDLQNNPKIIELFLDENKLSSATLSKCLHLEQLKLNDNKLKRVDLSANTQLIILQLSNNCLQDVVFWFTKGMQWSNQSIFSLHNQNSQICKITILYNNQHEQECQNFMAKGMKGFELKGFFSRLFYFNKGLQQFQNKYNCYYRFQMTSKI